MPELAKPLSFFGTILKEQRNSKSPTVPLVQIRKVFPLIGSSAVVCPVIAPSLTDQSFGFPSQPVRSRPLKIFWKPDSLGCACSAAEAARASKRALEANALVIFL